MQRKHMIITAAAAITVGSLAAASAVAASGLPGIDDDASDTPITGDALAQASAAALARTGGGRVTETEVGDEDSYYEVEVTFDDGHQVDVQLDQAFTVVQTMDDHEDGTGSADN